MAERRNEKLRLSVFMQADSNYHAASWRHPEAVADAGANIARWIDFARMLEAAKFDMLFVADMSGISGLDQLDALERLSGIERFEPTTLLSALAMVTSRLGLVATCATTYAEPYGVARSLASLDLLSGGRAGWNVVTGGFPGDALNFSRPSYMPSTERYARGAEFVQVVTKLWQSIDAAAFLRDKESGRYVDSSGLRRIDHQGRHFSVQGPLNVLPSPQGRPILVQAGQSEEGRALAAGIGDVIFTAQPTLESAKAFSADIRRRMVEAGRCPADVRIMPGISVTVAETEAEAREKARLLDEMIDPMVGLARLQQNIPGIDLSQYDLDAPFPELEANDQRADTPVAFTAMARRDKLTLREVAMRAGVSKIHAPLVGTPEQVVDELELWFRSAAADGFNLLPATVPNSIADFIELVLPELRRRGLFRVEYEGQTLRQNLGLSMPRIGFAKERMMG